VLSRNFHALVQETSTLKKLLCIKNQTLQRPFHLKTQNLLKNLKKLERRGLQSKQSTKNLEDCEHRKLKEMAWKMLIEEGNGWMW
jgi:hypothetical protein